ncbi:hypothetical protein FHX42_000861 [Saccharopolyspora lacisalsi]|uniref:PH domain-containing protein n=1 Tax=Halosaccharopolyspora lacisalsi TaxID=1000566 RepID=A0A839DNI5_9PSEU|nr:transporter [Halosaccharopolyspora lacisalsi]MBA8823532.1 hypothetical protein [Halosaccharopolyspora lacisalsi]
MARVLWVLALALLAALVVYGMRRGWVNRARRQAAQLAEFPRVPEDLDERDPLLPAAEGLYVGSTRAEDWQDRIAVGDIGHRSVATAQLWSHGLLLRRSGASPLWIPAESLIAARVDHKLANKVVPGAGLLVVTWRLGEHLLDTGFRAEDTTEQPRWAEAVRALVPGDEPTRYEETAGTRQEEA